MSIEAVAQRKSNSHDTLIRKHRIVQSFGFNIRCESEAETGDWLLCWLSCQLLFECFLQIAATLLQIDCEEEKQVDSTQSGFQSNMGPCCNSRVKVTGCDKWPPPETDFKLLNLEHITAYSSPLSRTAKMITQVCCNYQDPQEKFPFLSPRTFTRNLIHFHLALATESKMQFQFLKQNTATPDALLTNQT